MTLGPSGLLRGGGKGSDLFDFACSKDFQIGRKLERVPVSLN